MSRELLERRVKALETAKGAAAGYSRVVRHIVHEPTREAQAARIAEIEAASAPDTRNIVRVIIAPQAERAPHRPLPDSILQAVARGSGPDA